MNKPAKKKQEEIKVFIVKRETECGECGNHLWRGGWITLEEERGALCLSCADLDHLFFLPSGDATLTRRAKKNSRLWAVVLEWSRMRKRYERQGLLVEQEALEKAEEECEADAEQRQLRRERQKERREQLDQDYIEKFAERVRELYPGCPLGRERIIAEHACRKYSGRVGRSAAAKEFDEKAISLAVKAHIRHAETNYDDLLMRGMERWEARDIIESKMSEVLDDWRGA